MAVFEEDVREEEIIQNDFKKAQEIYDRIMLHITKKTRKVVNVPSILFALCLIYARQLNHHKTEDKMLKTHM